MTDRGDILISLKPKHAAKIFGGKKTVELRKRRPNILPGTRVWIYATAPTAAIQGHAQLRQIESDSPSRIWRMWGDRTGLSKDEFDSYFKSCRIAHALVLDDVMIMKRALSLKRIRKLMRNFHPPQFYFRLNGATGLMRLPARKHRRVN